MPEASAPRESSRHRASFRDPAGFIFFYEGQPYRQVNACAAGDYDRLMQSGLYASLSESGRLLPHEEVADVPPAEVGLDGSAPYRILKPRRIGFVSYPYEWCFSQLKDAALLTLQVQREALDHGMTLKDCSAFNIQFEGAQPIFIDTLSFEPYLEGEPWAGYRQACQHFLAPLAVMSYCDVRLSQLLRRYLDGLPLDLAARLLPRRTLLRPSLAMHIHLHAHFQRSNRTEPDAPVKRKGRMSRNAMIGLIDSLQSAVKRLHWKAGPSEWGDYYDDTNYTEAAMGHKMQLVADYLDECRPATVWDLGANTGRFSRLASGRGITTLSLDTDPVAVERNYLDARRRGDRHLLPLWIDLTNPSAARGWAHLERASLTQRGPADLVLALALIHHLAIGSNVPLPLVAEYFAQIAHRVVVEWVPKHDSQVKRLFAVRKDVFPDYNEQAFCRAFERFFELEKSHPVADSQRVLYCYRRRSDALADGGESDQHAMA